MKLKGLLQSPQNSNQQWPTYNKNMYTEVDTINYKSAKMGVLDTAEM